MSSSPSSSANMRTQFNSWGTHRFQNVSLLITEHIETHRQIWCLGILAIMRSIYDYYSTKWRYHTHEYMSPSIETPWVTSTHCRALILSCVSVIECHSVNARFRMKNWHENRDRQSLRTVKWLLSLRVFHHEIGELCSTLCDWFGFDLFAIKCTIPECQMTEQEWRTAGMLHTAYNFMNRLRAKWEKAAAVGANRFDIFEVRWVYNEHSQSRHIASRWLDGRFSPRVCRLLLSIFLSLMLSILSSCPPNYASEIVSGDGCVCARAQIFPLIIFHEWKHLAFPSHFFSVCCLCMCVCSHLRFVHIRWDHRWITSGDAVCARVHADVCPVMSEVEIEYLRQVICERMVLGTFAKRVWTTKKETAQIQEETTTTYLFQPKQQQKKKEKRKTRSQRRRLILLSFLECYLFAHSWLLIVGCLRQHINMCICSFCR